MILKAIRNLFKQKKSAGILLRASVMMQRAIDEAEGLYQKTGHRYYVIYDPAQKKLIPITYDLYLGKSDSYIYLRRRGRFGDPLKREELKQRCFYYTPSKNVPDRRCIGKEKEEKLLRWQRYYSFYLHGRI